MTNPSLSGRGKSLRGIRAPRRSSSGSSAADRGHATAALSVHPDAPASAPPGRHRRHRLEFGAPRRLRGAVARADADLQREGAVRARQGRRHDRPLAAEAVEQGARGAALLPGAVPQHGHRATSTCSRPRRRATPPTAPEFLAPPRAAIGADIELIGGTREAELSALGVVVGFHEPDGIVGDLGGGSLELIDVRRHAARRAACRCRSAAWR